MRVRGSVVRKGWGLRARGGASCLYAYLHAVAAQVVPKDLVGHHTALCPHGQTPLAAGAQLRPQQEGPKHVSPQQGKGTGPGRAER